MMTFPEFWHWLTTSRYTRKLEAENEELRAQLQKLKAENTALIFALGKRPSFVPVSEREEEIQAAATKVPRNLRPGRFVGFSQVKKQLEQ